jgi:hypothetical protein
VAAAAEPGERRGVAPLQLDRVSCPDLERHAMMMGRSTRDRRITAVAAGGVPAPALPGDADPPAREVMAVLVELRRGQAQLQTELHAMGRVVRQIGGVRGRESGLPPLPGWGAPPDDA